MTYAFVLAGGVVLWGLFIFYLAEQPVEVFGRRHLFGVAPPTVDGPTESTSVTMRYAWFRFDFLECFGVFAVTVFLGRWRICRLTDMQPMGFGGGKWMRLKRDVIKPFIGTWLVRRPFEYFEARAFPEEVAQYGDGWNYDQEDCS